ncbi:GLPGLI family protein [Chryseobacterium geocarposphaerae]|uniref:GLPGLI family protein n=1 Tax=Chryseobacterium geocarposphaerae TaxID=1416776 RepID=A0A2M9C171_9FLAO|nr:GLPGLI family protein [Chryseobacterium geocarposphaerae]PJJ64176.1 GLPGLI family protein [Chryseobacterium geocarposphaerae]
MKRILLLLIMMSFCINAQTQRFIYELQFKMDSTQSRYEKINYVLDVNPKDVKFYEYNYLRSDSINKATGRYDHQYGGWFPSLKRERNSNKNQNYELIGHDMFSFPSEDKISWNLTNETKKFGENTLQKATANFGGRSWVAWFNKEVNISEGPYKFRGLPGLIFRLEDSGSNFIFTLIKNNNLKETYDTVGFVETYYGTKPLEVSEKVRNRKKLDFYNDPLQDMRRDFKENMQGEMFVMGTKVTKAEQFNDLTKKLQEMLRKSNNPIERDKAMKYE